MDLIFVNRKIFNKLKDDEKLVKEYLKDIIIQLDLNNILIDNYDNLTLGLYTIISKNEKLIKKVGLKNYYNNNYDVKDYVEEAWYTNGLNGLLAFDWSMSNENDNNWNYSFNIFKIL